jgi:hypothetical protein
MKTDKLTTRHVKTMNHIKASPPEPFDTFIKILVKSPKFEDYSDSVNNYDVVISL